VNADIVDKIGLVRVDALPDTDWIAVQILRSRRRRDAAGLCQFIEQLDRAQLIGFAEAFIQAFTFMEPQLRPSLEVGDTGDNGLTADECLILMVLASLRAGCPSGARAILTDRLAEDAIPTCLGLLSAVGDGLQDSGLDPHMREYLLRQCLRPQASNSGSVH
jgi:hypothetical protein